MSPCFPPFITSPIDDDVEIPEKYLYDLTIPKLNEIVDELQKSDATHVMLFDADCEAPPEALKLLLAYDVDVASGISPPRKNWKYTTALHYVAAPTPALIQSEPYFRPYTMQDLRHVTVGANELVATGHFCCLIKRSIFDTFRFRWPGLKVTKSKLVECPACGAPHHVSYDCAKSRLGAEILFWMDAQMLGFSVVIDGNVLCGHLPNWPLSELVE